uniref:Uncharacterized protein n=1 Tax=Hyaloperonospora arabidopsidis (strain Emoy2) TaxID=559515 RepID=M4C0C9_HYAAE
MALPLSRENEYSRKLANMLHEPFSVAATCSDHAARLKIVVQFAFFSLSRFNIEVCEGVPRTMQGGRI